MSDLLITILTLVAAYLLGSIPFGLMVARRYGVADIRQHGSGNIGATNVGRVAGVRAATLVYMWDILKGVSAALLGKFAAQEFGSALSVDHMMLVCGLAAIVGHVFSIFLRFSGGKGVNTLLGVMFVILPVQTFTCLLIFLLMAAIFRIVSLASVVATLCLFPVILVGHFVFRTTLNPAQLLMAIILGGMVIFTHRANLKRLARGTEPRFSFSGNKSHGGSHAR